MLMKIGSENVVFSVGICMRGSEHLKELGMLKLLPTLRSKYVALNAKFIIFCVVCIQNEVERFCHNNLVLFHELFLNPMKCCPNIQR